MSDGCSWRLPGTFAPRPAIGLQLRKRRQGQPARVIAIADRPDLPSPGQVLRLEPVELGDAFTLMSRNR
jgi:hypothetical protein